ncbi:ATP-binding protein [Methylobacterium sp. Leaf100]|uniref:ATP-binding protein n=1 Tax=Methylobacterium sp. Leaf100 TaxID=1736252 RepID=UPI000A4620DD|nr:ATP-binding protein [Methylobacterium sp. Leaf100]
MIQTKQPPGNPGRFRFIQTITPGRIGSLPPIATAGLPFDTLAACLRPDTAKRNVERLVAASRTLTQADPGLADVPLIRDALGYEGGAWEWGMSVVEAVERCRANGSNDFSSLESPRIILGGPPGCGKTVFARTVAKSAALPLHIASVGAWFTQGSGYLGDVIRAIDMTFAQATSAGPAVLLLDEIDAIPDRSTVDARHLKFWVTVVSHILTTFYGESSNRSSALIIIATTNWPAP